MVISFALAVAIIAGTTMVFVRGVKAVRAAKPLMVCIVFGLVAVAALAIGVRFGVFGEFRLSERVRIQGAPVPLVVFVLEGDNWTDFVKPLPIGCLCMVANALFPVGLIGLLWVLAVRRFQRSPRLPT